MLTGLRCAPEQVELRLGKLPTPILSHFVLPFAYRGAGGDKLLEDAVSKPWIMDAVE